MKKNKFCIAGNACVIAFCLLALSCTFDYGDTDSTERTLPDLVMRNVEYVRVRSADPIARIRAERLDRYDDRGIMNLENFTFEQYRERGEEVSTFGSAGFASVNIETVDILMERGVRIEIESEDIIVETEHLSWRDGQRLLTTGEDDEVAVFQQTGTSFTGVGLVVDARRRTWEFLGPVSGTYVHQDDAEDAESQNGD